MTEDAGRAPAPDTRLTLAQVMLPEDANPHGHVHGGTLMKLADTAGGVCATRFTRSQVATVVMDSMTFEHPVYVGDLVVLNAEVTWSGRTSIEVEVTVDAENVIAARVQRVSHAYFVYVAIDEHGRPRPIRRFEPSSDDERRRWVEAEQRRERRLAEAGSNSR